MQIVTTENRVIGTLTWTEGFLPLRSPVKKLTEADALAHALWLEKHVSSEAGNEFIERWLRDLRFVI